MNEQENSQCPYCGAPISKTDKYCKNCGKVLIKYSDFAQPQPPQSAWSTPIPPPEEAYERKYSMFQRFYKLIFSPSEAMKDIGHAPDYNGPIILVTLKIILSVFALSVALQKIQFVGDSSIVTQVYGFLSASIAIGVIIAVFLLLAFWLIKSFLVKITCDSGSGWAFATTASVTGYAYIADVIFGIIALIGLYILAPSITINVTDPEAARQALVNYQTQTFWIRLLFFIPFSFAGIIWKSFLGGVGTKFGTKEKASIALGFFVFLGLALLGWLISYIATGNI
jgi:hypothetical protein